MFSATSYTLLQLEVTTNMSRPLDLNLTVPIGEGFGGPGRPDQSPQRRPQQGLVFNQPVISTSSANTIALSGFQQNNIITFDGVVSTRLKPVH